MSLAAVTESVTVVGADAQPLAETAQVATNFKQDLMATLPSNRTIDAVMLMAPSVHATGPRGAFSINGALSYENLYTLNGAVIVENLRGARVSALHRGRSPGSDCGDRRRVGGIRPLYRRDDQRGHEVRRRHVQRLAAHVVRERLLALD